MSGTVDPIGDMSREIATALIALRGAPPTVDAPFKYVAHWSGELDSLDLVSKAVVPNSPAALVAFTSLEASGDPSEQAVDNNGVTENVATVTFTVLCAFADTRAAGAALNATTPMSVGAYRCMGLVARALNNLFLANTYQSQPMRVVSAAPYLVVPGTVYVGAVVVAARYVIEDAAIVDPYAGEAVELVDADANIIRVGVYDDGTDAVDDDVRVTFDPVKASE